MRLVAGLGNPGTKYHNTRHNFGFMAVDALLDRFVQQGKASAWRERDGALVSEIKSSRGPVVVVKPQEFMNLSGRAVAQILNFHKIPHDQLLVAHDEIDLPLGTMRFKKGGGDGGHNGLHSIIDCCGGADFVRLRLGVGRPQNQRGDDEDAVSRWVLGRFSPAEKPLQEQILVKAVEGMVLLLETDLKTAQNRYNLSIEPPSEQ